MSTKILLTSVVAFGIFVFSSCGTKVPPVSERIKKVWIAQTVKENTTEVYNRSGSSTKPGYSTYKLDLSAAPAVTLKDIDGGTYTGTYSVTATSLSITGLTPQPTGTGGSLTFTITSLADDASTLVLTATQPYPKTGNTTNVYSLVAGN